MVNVSIISTCNNNCKYCFQHKDYHKQGLMLTYEDIADILEWSRGESRIALLGGEPTLHPDIVKIVVRCLQDRPTLLFSNLLGPTPVMEELLSRCHNANWLVNTTTRDDMKDLFETNVELFRKYRVKFSAGITLMLDEEYDTRNINNLVRLGMKYGDLIDHYRIAQATPYEEGQFDLSSFSKPIYQFCELAKQNTPNIRIGFDCPTNCCQVPEAFFNELIYKYHVNNLKLAYSCGPIFDIMADKSIKYCSSTPDDLIPIKNYRDFANAFECRAYLEYFKNEYLRIYGGQCRQYAGCTSSMCPGSCFAITAHLNQYLANKQKSANANA